MKFTEIGDRVFLAVEPLLRVNATLVVGEGRALVVDTLSTEGQARALLDAVRAVTPHPLTIVNTHHHFDHSFGNAVLAAGTGTAGADAPVWAHEAAALLLRDSGPRLQREWYEEWLPHDADLAGELGRMTIRPPDHTVRAEATLDIGGRPVVLRHLGLGHTAGDLVAEVPGAGVVVAGDLVEEGAAPCFGDAYPIAWPDTLGALRRTLPQGAKVVPGHGAVVSGEFVQAQHDELTALSWLIRETHADGGDPLAVARKTSLTRFGEQGLHEARMAVVRGYEELDAAL
jgi:glyoxylase-like metal-dependent hydrolase (beta-lactamase superfamily II)